MHRILIVLLFLLSNGLTVVAQNVLVPGYNLYPFDFQPRPIGMVFDSSGDLFVSDFLAPTRAIYHIEQVNGVYVSETIEASGNSGVFKPQYLAIDPNDNVYFSKSNSNDGGIYVLDQSGNIDTIFSPLGVDFLDPRGLAFDASGDLFVACNNNGSGGAYVAKFELNSNNQVIAQDLNFIGPFSALMDLQFDGLGNLYLASDENLVKVEFDASGAVTNVDANFCVLPTSNPSNSFVAGIAIDSDNDMLVSQLQTNNADSGKIYIIDANGGYSLFAEGFNQPRDIAFATDNRLYISDSEGSMIYVIECDGEDRLGSDGTFCENDVNAVDEIGVEGMVSVFPNPTSGVFNVVLLNGVGNVQVELINSLGQTKVQRSASGEGQILFDLSRESAGIYQVLLLSNGVVLKTTRIIKY